MTSLLLNNIQQGRVVQLVLDKSLPLAGTELGTTHFGALISALRCTTSNRVRSVELTDHFGNQIYDHQLRLLLQTIAGMPTLRRFRVYTNTCVWPVAYWTRVLETAVGLQSWNVTRGIRIDSQDDIQCLAEVIRHHPSLKEVSLMDFGVDAVKLQTTAAAAATLVTARQKQTPRILRRLSSSSSLSTQSNESTSNFVSRQGQQSQYIMTLDPLVNALSTLPCLETIDLTVGSDLVPFMCRVSNQSLQQLLSSPLLLDVSLWDFGLDDAHMPALTAALQHHESLQFLSLRRNRGISHVGWHRFAVMMQHNYTLVSLYKDRFCNDTTLDSDSNDCNKKAKAFQVANDRLRLFLWLNRLGRRELLQQSATFTTAATTCKGNNTNKHQDQQWVAFLNRVGDRPDALFYLLQAKPLLLLQEFRSNTRPQTSSTETV